jgi:hypothetical protein
VTHRSLEIKQNSKVYTYWRRKKLKIFNKLFGVKENRDFTIDMDEFLVISKHSFQSWNPKPLDDRSYSHPSITHHERTSRSTPLYSELQNPKNYLKR